VQTGEEYYCSDNGAKEGMDEQKKQWVVTTTANLSCLLPESERDLSRLTLRNHCEEAATLLLFVRWMIHQAINLPKT
jgi:hypothetical protein